MALERVRLRRWLLLAAIPAALAAQGETAVGACDHVPTYTPCDITVDLGDRDAAAHPHPYADVELRAEFRSPRGRTFPIPAFWDGGRRMVLRFSPVEPGEWEYKLTSNVVDLDARQGTFTAVATDSPGFIRPANLHHWQYTERLIPHIWMGVTELRYAYMDDDAFRTVVDTRADQKFTHFRGLIMAQGLDPAFTGSGDPNVAFFQKLDKRVRYINDKHMVADLILAGGANYLYKLFPTPEERRKFIRFIAARYAPMNVTWQLVDRFEETNNARDLLKETGGALKEADPYQHPRSTGAAITSAPLLDDGWETYTSYGPADDAVGAIEHQLYGVPGVSIESAREDSGAGRILPQDLPSDAFRHRIWNATMDGLYPSYTNTGEGTKYAGAPGARAMTVWYNLMAETRHWELEPYFDVDGGRALALEGVEYLLYIEKPGPIEIDVEQHSYDIVWVDPADGSVIRKKYSGQHFTGEPPSRTHDWLLHIVRENELASMARSYKFESVDVALQEIESHPEKVVFDLLEPSGPLAISKPAPYAAKLKRASRGTRTMMYLWTGEVFADHLGYRVLATGESGTMQIPPSIAGNFPATMLLRVYALNALGKVYLVSKGFDLTQ